MKYLKQLAITKFSHEVLENEKKKYLNSKDKISYSMLTDIAIIKTFCPEKILLLKQVKKYRELINVYEK